MKLDRHRRSDSARRGRVSGQGPGEVGDEVLIAAVGRAGTEHVPAARAAGQLGRPPGVARGDRHHPRGRPADLDRHLAAAAGNVAAAQRHQLAGPQPGADAEHHQGQRRAAFGRIALGGGDRGQLRPLGRASTAPAPSRPQTASPAARPGRAPASASRYSADRYVPRVEHARPARPATQNASITS